MECDEPLVSVVVITYNSSETVIETLESIKSQTYFNLELVISDDCSSDCTVELCRHWIDLNKSRFFAAILSVSQINKGIGANINKGIACCKGDWIKSIAGDDLLAPDCIAENINYIKQFRDAQVIFSKSQVFNEKGKQNIFFNGDLKSDFGLTLEEQLIRMYKRSFVPTPSVFIKATVLKDYPYPEKYVILEDYPMWIQLLENGFKFYYFDKVTTYYRVHSSASRDKGYFVKESFINIVKYHFYDNIYPKIYLKYPEIVRYHQKQFLLSDIQLFFLRNKVNIFTRIINKFFTIILQ